MKQRLGLLLILAGHALPACAHNTEALKIVFVFYFGVLPLLLCLVILGVGLKRSTLTGRQRWQVLAVFLGVAAACALLLYAGLASFEPLLAPALWIVPSVAARVSWRRLQALRL